jgi:single-strand DNA-binding protein
MSTTLIGNVVADPEIKFNNAGNAWATFSIAVNKKGKNDVEYTSYFDCIVSGKIAENFCESIKKGVRCIVFGELKQRTYEDKDGNKRSAVELQAWSVGPDLSWATAKVTKNDKLD